MKPKMQLVITDDNSKQIERAASILAANGYKQEAKDIHKRAKAYGYEFFIVLRLLKEYMEI